jgi:hypothetical protein
MLLRGFESAGGVSTLMAPGRFPGRTRVISVARDTEMDEVIVSYQNGDLVWNLSRFQTMAGAYRFIRRLRADCAHR